MAREQLWQISEFDHMREHTGFKMDRPELQKEDKDSYYTRLTEGVSDYEMPPVVQNSTEKTKNKDDSKGLPKSFGMTSINSSIVDG